MIRQKRLQVLLYVLHASYVSGNTSLRSKSASIFSENEIDDTKRDYVTETEITLSENAAYNTWFVDNGPNDIATELSTTLVSTPNDDSQENGQSSTIGSSDTESTKSVYNGGNSTSHPDNSSDYQTDDDYVELDCKSISSVQNLIVENVLEYSLNVSWDPPVEESCVSKYHINAYFDTSETTTTTSCATNNTHVTLTELRACTTYTVEVIPESTYGKNGTRVKKNQTTANSRPGEVSNLAASPGTLWVYLSWDTPGINPSCVTHYIIQVFYEEDSNKLVTTLNTSYTNYNVTALNPCVSYIFTVIAVGEGGESEGVSISNTTSYLSPTMPLSLAAEPGEFSLIVTWEPPSRGATCIKEYRVTVWDTTTERTRKTRLVITGLRACGSYTVQVTPVGLYSGDGDFSFVGQTTAPSITDPPVPTVYDPLVTTNSITLTWSVANNMNNCTLKSVLTYCNYISSDGHGYTLTNGQSEDPLSPSTDVIVNVIVSQLSPFTTYSCRGITVNSAGSSQLGTAVIVKTAEDIPSSPTLIAPKIVNGDFIFTWTEPQYLPGYLGNYEIILNWDPVFLIPDWCPENTWTRDNISHIDSASTSYAYSNGQYYSNYTATIRARTGAGWGEYSDIIVFLSEPGVPENVSFLNYVNTTRSDDPNVLENTLSWGLPCSLNGEIDFFYVAVNGTRDGYADHSFYKIKNVTTDLSNNKTFTIDLGELYAEYHYIFKVYVKVMGVHQLGSSTDLAVLYPAGIPALPNDSYIESIRIDPYKARKSTTEAAILLPLFPNINGDIHYYAIMIAEEEYNDAYSLRFDIKSGAWPNVFTWQDAVLHDFKIPYQATIPHWNPNDTNSSVVDYGTIKAVRYLLGGDSDCKELSGPFTLYCNGPLKPGTTYHVRMRAFTNGGYADSPFFIVKTDAELNVGLVIGVVFGILFLGILTTMMLLVRRGTIQAVLRRFLHSDMPGSPVPAPFTRRKFIAHCQQLADNPGKLSNEFQLLQTLSVDLQMPTNAACLQANKKKNRYSDILPYDFSRVKLQIIDNDPNTDYINASFIRGYTVEEEYIACQGPKPETSDDFWRMIDQYDVKIIVMLTQLVEKGKEKCHQYFPTIRESFANENMEIRCTSELDYRSHTQRTLTLRKLQGTERRIIHLHFKDWPDYDVPEDFDPMITFCQNMRRQINANKGLAVIHCSAGVGRTGTLIAIDILLQHIRDNRKLDVFGTVYRLRHQRINMVQRESQYAYIYNCIRQVLKNPYFAKTYDPPPVDPIYENSSTNLASSFETLQKSSLSASIDSKGSLYESSPQSDLKDQGSLLNNGLKFSRSTGAITIKPQKVHKNNSENYSIYELVKVSVSERIKDNEDDDNFTEYKSAAFENKSTLNRSKSANAINRKVYT